MYSRVRWSLCVALCLACVPSASAQTAPGGQPTIPGSPRPAMPAPAAPARDAGPLRAATGSAGIRGRVLDLESGRPLRRARVSVQTALPGERPRAAITDSDGRFDLRRLPAGRYTLQASKPGFANAPYGRPGTRTPGRTIDLADGQLVDGITVSLPKGAVITGRVVDEEGEALSEVTVVALQYQSVGGKRRLMPVNGAARANDLGIFRLPGLAAGEYFVSSTYLSPGADLEVEEGGERGNYAPMYFPGTASFSEAQTVRVRAGEEVNADFQLVAVRGASISGVAVDASGQPLSRGFVSLRASGEPIESNMRGGSIRGDGGFVINAIPPGSYTATVMGVRTFDAASGQALGPREQVQEVGRVALSVGSEPITGIRLTTSRGVTIAGRITFEGGVPSSMSRSLQVACMPTDGEAALPGAQAGQTRPDLTFELRGVHGPCVLAALAPRWMVKVVRVSGTDVTDLPIDLSSGRSLEDVEIVMTDRLPTITGTVSDDAGPVRDYTVVVFPADAGSWRMPSRRIRAAHPDQNGLFSLAGLPPGEYLAIALREIEPGAEQDPALLERLRDGATPATVTSGGMHPLTLKLQAAADR